MKIKNPLRLLICILICQSAGIIGSFFTFGSVTTWYSTLIRPEFAPPNWVFAPAWLTLYTLMGISLYLILQKKNVKDAIYLFGLQLGLNALWSILFFGMQNPLYGLIDIVLLWIVLLITTRRFLEINRTAGLLLFPYVFWVTFATLLNYNIWMLNI